MASLDLDAYFQRIGYVGARDPNLQTLAAIQPRHAQVIAFENLDPLLRRPVNLDLDSLQQKLVHGGRGGYCFEQNLLLMHALQALGYRVTGLAARVLWNVPDGTITARGHMLLRVDIDASSYVVDVGFGILTPTAPLRLEADIAQTTPHEPFRLRRDGDEFVMQAQVLGKWRSMYRFSLQPQLAPDYEVSSWYLSNHPNSHFVTGLMAARPDAGRRYTLHNNEFTERELSGKIERRTLSSAGEIRDALRDVFQLALPDTPNLDAALARLIAARSD